jgi:hypothetical protein
VPAEARRYRSDSEYPARYRLRKFSGAAGKNESHRSHLGGFRFCRLKHIDTAIHQHVSQPAAHMQALLIEGGSESAFGNAALHALDYTRSITAAMPCPPPMHIVIRP